MIQTVVTDNNGKQETFASENKFEAVVIGMRAAFKHIKSQKDLETWMEKSPMIFNLLWSHGSVALATFVAIELLDETKTR
jgi:hypothetical protein